MTPHHTAAAPSSFLLRAPHYCGSHRSGSEPRRSHPSRSGNPPALLLALWFCRFPAALHLCSFFLFLFPALQRDVHRRHDLQAQHRVLWLVNQRGQQGTVYPASKAATLRRQQNIPHGMARVIGFRNGLASIAIYPDIERQIGSPVVPPLSPRCLCLSATIPFDVIAPPPRVTSPFRITLLLIRVVSASIINSPCFAGNQLRGFDKHGFNTPDNPAPGGRVVFEPAAILVCGHVRAFRVGRRRARVGVDSRNCKRCFPIAAQAEQHHLLPRRRTPPGAGFTGAVGQPINPVGFEVACFQPAQPAVPVHLGHNAGADQIGDKAHDFG